jgi:hypothetical protein
MSWLDELMRVSVSASNMVQAKQQRNNADVTDLLPELGVPALVLHALGPDEQLRARPPPCVEHPRGPVW